MATLKRLSISYKIIYTLLFFGIQLFGFPIQKHQLSDFYDQVHKQSLKHNFVRFRGRYLVSRDFHRIASPRIQKELIHHLVLVRGKIDKFIYLSEFRGVGVGSDQDAYLHFDIRYFETLKDIGIGGEFVAMCVLPRYDKCLLLGYEMF